MDTHSDLESVFSLDSLEGAADIEVKTRLNTANNSSLAKCKNSMIPYYTGEIPVEEIKSIKSNVKPRNAYSVSPKRSKIPKLQTSYREGPKNERVSRASSCIWNNTQSKLSTCSNRTSRSKELSVQNINSLRTRQRSVSYLDQFRKKHYGGNNSDSSSCSTAGSKLSDRDKNMSFISCFSGDSSMSTSEFEFYDELISGSGKEQLTWKQDMLKSSTLLTEKSVKSEKSNKQPKQIKAKPVILSRIEVKIPDQPKPNLDKKRSLEKREIYANNVKLRNEMKINQQREKDKKSKFNSSNILSNRSLEECFFNPQIDNLCLPIPTSVRKTSSLHSSNVATQEHLLRNESKKVTNELLPKTKRKGMPKMQQKINKKDKTISELSRMQERHEREKSLIESIKNLVLKT